MNRRWRKTSSRASGLKKTANSNLLYHLLIRRSDPSISPSEEVDVSLEMGEEDYVGIVPPKQSQAAKMFKSTESISIKKIEHFDMTSYIQAKMSQYGYAEEDWTKILKKRQVGLVELVTRLELEQEDKHPHSFQQGSNPSECEVCGDPESDHDDFDELLMQRPKRQTENVSMTCGICYSDIETYEAMLLLDCNHTYCEECLIQYITF